MRLRELQSNVIWIDSHGVDHVQLKFYQVSSHNSTFPESLLNNLTLDYNPLLF